MGFAELGEVLLRNNLRLKRRLRRESYKPLEHGLAFKEYKKDPVEVARQERRIKLADQKRKQRSTNEYLLLLAVSIIVLVILAIVLT